MIDPNRDTPSVVTQIVTNHGGSNRYGRPMWRVILAQNHMSKKRGTWHEFADGRSEQFEVGPGGRMAYNPTHAIRVVTEVRETPMYPVKGWIMERWMPPEVFGFHADWSSDWGPYPEEGDYLMLGGPWEHMPELGDICRAIDEWNREWDARPKSYTEAFRVFQEEERRVKEAEEKRMDDDFNAFYRGEIKPVFESTSLEAQRVRNEAAETAGVRSHIGAGQ